MKHWQENGIRIAGQLFDENESAALVQTLRRQIKDLALLAEVEAFLAGRGDLSKAARQALQTSAAALIMRSPKD